MDSTTSVGAAASGVRRRLSPIVVRQNKYGYLFLTPWLIGFFGLFLGPALASLRFSFTQYDVLSPAKWIGTQNYVRMFTNDNLFYTSLVRTLYFTGLSVPLGVFGSMTLAILLNMKVRGKVIFRTLFFMPSLVPLVSAVVLWLWLLNPDWGIVNNALRGLGVNPPAWFGDRDWALPSLAMVGLWGSIGGTRMIIFLAGLQGIPEEMYDAAQIDGAGAWNRIRHITIPLLSPTIFFNLVLAIIGALQSFQGAFVATEGGPAYATWFFGMHIYKHAFDYWNMGYASALAWFFAVVIISLTIAQQRLSTKWVYYYGE
jgi:multiple sugar transport system permease protein